MGRRLSRGAISRGGPAISDDARPFAIVGGLGKTGRRVAALLEGEGHGIRPLSRSTIPSFDWDRPDGWRAALAGARAAYVAFQPDLSVPHAIEAIGRLAHVAAEEGLERIVLLSGRGEDGARRAEQALATSGIDWAVVRASWFAQNFSESFLAEALHTGELVIPVGTAAEPFVDADDIAQVAVALLLGTASSGRVYEVTGPEALGFAHALAILGAATGRTLACREVDVATFQSHLRRNGAPEDMVAMLVELFTTTLDGRNSATATGIEDALGRAPRSFADYAGRAASERAGA